MFNLSLRLRTFAAALLVLLIFIPLTAITLEEAFNRSLSQSMAQQLRVQSLSLISEFEFSSNQVVMPEQLYNDQFNIPGSGLYAFIQSNKQTIWSSLSTLNWQLQPEFSPPEIGQEKFIADFSMLKGYFLYAYTAEFEGPDGYQAVSFTILQDKHIYNAEKDKFATTLWNWLSLIALLLIILLLVSLNAALLPISRLNEQIRLAENGQLKRIQQKFPPELDKLKNSINHLLNTEEQQRLRYKNSLSDLAHSLKTPLAVLAGTEHLPVAAREPINQIDQQIQRQLKRAVAGTSGAFEQATPIQPVIAKLVNAMHKVYADKALKVTAQTKDKDAEFQGDTTDLMEILGNVLDNACKAARQQVLISSVSSEHRLNIQIEDDGPGIPAAMAEKLLERGIRLDSYTEGQGIGMAVVADLVAAYQGQLAISQSPLGGALISLTFPCSQPEH